MPKWYGLQGLIIIITLSIHKAPGCCCAFMLFDGWDLMIACLLPSYLVCFTAIDA
jgi:hypothetical protein